MDRHVDTPCRRTRVPIDLSTPLLGLGHRMRAGWSASLRRLSQHRWLALGMVSAGGAAAAAAASVAGWVPSSFARLAIVVGIGGAISATALISHRDAVPAPAPSIPPALLSAFVCSKCAEFTPPPDWASLLAESGPTSEDGDPAGALRPGLPAVVPPADDDESGPRFPTSVGVTAASPVPSSGPSPAAPDSPVRDELFFVHGRLVPASIADPPRSPPARTPLPPPNRSPLRIDRPEPGPSRHEIAVDRPLAELGVGSTSLTLDFWIRTAAAGLVARSRGAAGASVVLVPLGTGGGEAPLGPPETDGTALTCAACRQSFDPDRLALECPDCRRPICTACTHRVVEHAGALWCGPCAVNRIGSAFLGAVERGDWAPELVVAPGLPN